MPRVLRPAGCRSRVVAQGSEQAIVSARGVVDGIVGHAPEGDLTCEKTSDLRDVVNADGYPVVPAGPNRGVKDHWAGCCQEPKPRRLAAFRVKG